MLGQNEFLCPETPAPQPPSFRRSKPFGNRRSKNLSQLFFLNPPEEKKDVKRRSLQTISPRPSPRYYSKGSHRSMPVDWKNTINPKKNQSLLELITQAATEEQSQKIYKELLLACKMQWGDSEDSKHILDFVDACHQLNNSSSGSIAYFHFSKIVAELIYLIQHSPKTSLKLTDKKQILQSIDKIAHRFKKSIAKIHKKINEQYHEHVKMGYDNAEIIKHIAIPLAISKILIPHSGCFLDPLIPEILTEFIQNSNPYSFNLKVGLKLLKQDEELRKKIEAIKLPDNADCPIVRMANNLSQNIKISDYHAKRTALAALLTHLRQKQNGSCFASFIAIEVQLINPIAAVSDFHDLIMHSKLTRNVEGDIYHFPFLMKVDTHDALQTLCFNKDGEILNTKSKTFLWDNPGIQAICRYLGINCQNHIKQWLIEGSIEEGSALLLLEQMSHKHSIDFEHLKIIFSSTTHHPLLSMWENSIAGMAEGLKNSILKSALVPFILYLIKFIAGTQQLTAQIQEIYSKIEENIVNRCAYLFDPSFSVKDPTKSAFVLYDCKDPTDFSKWKQITAAADFQIFIKELVEEVWPPELEACKTNFFNALTEKEALLPLLKKYHQENDENSLNLQNIKYLRFTPWATFIGNDPKMTLKVYNEGKDPLVTKSLTPTSAEEFLVKLKEAIQTLPENVLKNSLYYDDFRIPIRIVGLHSFSLLLSHPTMKTFLENKKKRKSSYAPAPFTALPMQKKLIEFASNLVKQKYQAQLFGKLLLLPEKTKIHELRNAIIDIVHSFLPPFSSINNLQAALDLKIIELLPDLNQKAIEEDIIHFADTNWHKDVNDIHYGIGINPGSGKTEIISVLDNGKIHQFLPQKQFFEHQVWELFVSSKI